MPNLIDKPQLQATAQVAKSYILDQDTANVNTIINALQQSGGGNTKQEGIITIGGYFDRGNTITLTSNSGEGIDWFHFTSGDPTGGNWGYVKSGGTLLIANADFQAYTFVCPANNNYTAAYRYENTEE